VNNLFKRDLIGSAKLNFDNENNIKTNKSTVSNFQMDAIDSNDLEKTDKNEPGTQTENCFENLIEENCNYFIYNLDRTMVLIPIKMN